MPTSSTNHALNAANALTCPGFSVERYSIVYIYLSQPGIDATQKLTSSQYVWPFVNKVVLAWARHRLCIPCQRFKVNRHTVSPYLLTFQALDLRTCI